MHLVDHTPRSAEPSAPLPLRSLDPSQARVDAVQAFLGEDRSVRLLLKETRGAANPVLHDLIVSENGRGYRISIASALTNNEGQQTLERGEYQLTRNGKIVVQDRSTNGAVRYDEFPRNDNFHSILANSARVEIMNRTGHETSITKSELRHGVPDRSNELSQIAERRRIKHHPGMSDLSLPSLEKLGETDPGFALLHRVRQDLAAGHEVDVEAALAAADLTSKFEIDPASADRITGMVAKQKS